MASAPRRRAQRVKSSPHPPAAELVGWFDGAARDLPWRPGAGQARNPYHALVSEAMLQQTQVSRVIGYFERFIGRFPTVAALAAAEESEVLALWSGLGYYRRAKNLHAAARMIVAEFGGVVPGEPEELMRLPGVGRYTAGAIASIAFDKAAPIVDGNVMRVLLRVHGRGVDPTAKGTIEWAWRAAEEMVAGAAREDASSAGRFNEGLMELGATVCLPPPGAPLCGACPWRNHCVAFDMGVTGAIPSPKPVKGARTVFADAVIAVRARDGAILMEQRPEKGMWAGMWQVPTLEWEDRGAKAAEVGAFVGAAGGRAPTRLERFVHKTTHRTIAFTVWRVKGAVRKKAGQRWVRQEEMRGLGISNAQRRVLRMAWG